MDRERDSRVNNTTSKKRPARSSSSSSCTHFEPSSSSKSSERRCYFHTLKRSKKRLARGNSFTSSTSESDPSFSSESCEQRGSHQFSKRSKKRPPGERLTTSKSDSETSSSSKSYEQRKLKLKKNCERKQDHRKRSKLQSNLHRRKMKVENHEKKHKYCSSDPKENTQEKCCSKQKKRLKPKFRNSGELFDFKYKVEETLRLKSQTKLQVMMEAREHQKAVILQSAKEAKAKLASGELQRARLEQIRMHRLYGSVDWRAKKKLKTERQRLERTLAAGRKLASMEEREIARMDAFRVALGLPTAEAQRQAEWRAEATRALDESRGRLADAENIFLKSEKKAMIGPHLPHM